MSIKNYIKKPVVIQAMQNTGTNFPELKAFVGPNIYIKAVAGDPVYIKTLEGDMLSLPGDYIIKGVEGEFYSCKEKIFLKTYEETTLKEIEHADKK